MLGFRTDRWQNESKDTLTLYVADPLATAKFPMYSVIADTGALVHALVRAAPGKRVIGVNEWLSLRDIATILAQVLGKRVEFVDRNPTFELGDAEMEKDHRDMMGFCVEFGYDGGKVDKSIVHPGGLGVPVQLASVKEWVEKQDWESVLDVE
jgi:hypothetical protein